MGSRGPANSFARSKDSSANGSGSTPKMPTAPRKERRRMFHEFLEAEHQQLILPVEPQPALQGRLVVPACQRTLAAELLDKPVVRSVDRSGPLSLPFHFRRRPCPVDRVAEDVHQPHVRKRRVAFRDGLRRQAGIRRRDLAAQFPVIVREQSPIPVDPLGTMDIPKNEPPCLRERKAAGARQASVAANSSRPFALRCLKSPA